MTISVNGDRTDDPLNHLQQLMQSQPRRATAHEYVHDALRRGILGGLLPGGFQLGQVQIAEALGVSTTPVREALRRLSSEGLLDFGAFRTPQVHQPTLGELEEVYDLRRLLESYAMSKAVPIISDEQLERAEKIHRQMVAEEDPTEWLILNAAFHSVLTECCNAPKLESFLETLRASVALYVGLAIRQRPERRVESNAEHAAMIEACRTRDVERALEATRRHMDPARDLAESVLTDDHAG